MKHTVFMGGRRTGKTARVIKELRCRLWRAQRRLEHATDPESVAWLLQRKLQLHEAIERLEQRRRI